MKVKINYENMRDSNLSVFAEDVVVQLTGNTNFTFTEGVLTSLATASTTYAQKLAATLGGGKVNTAEKRAARITLVALLRSVAQQVNLQGNNDEVILKTSGFMMAYETTEPKPLQVPTDFEARPGSNPLELYMTVKSHTQVDSYVFCYGPADTAGNLSNLQQRVSADNSVTISNLEPNVKYVCRVFYTGRKKVSEFSSLQYSYVMPA
ncbi:fibronectin type III domain-containing protein [Pustulibacterium marinum]|nr:fibronectin type III domain-containing protein [Pustulibacterium marinum]